MAEFIGSRISLISRSDIRYVGLLHEINSDESTVSLENVKSFGTEGRKGRPEEEVPPSDEIYEYVIFRGTDVKDLRIEEGPSAVKENKPPAMPNDPAIVGARARPQNPPAPPAPQNVPGGSQFPYYPPNMANWGRPGGPPPAPGPFGGMQYPPPPGWFPPAQGFPPPGPGPWNNYPFPGQGGPGAPGVPGMAGAPGALGDPGAPSGPNNRQAQSQQPDTRPPPIGANSGSDGKSATPVQQTPATLPTESKLAGQTTTQAPPPPINSKPTVEEVKATTASLASNQQGPTEQKGIPAGPKNARSAQILPAVPLPAALTAKASQQTQAGKDKASEDQSAQAALTAAALRDATQAAKAAVAVAMAKFDAPAAAQQANGNAVDNLTKKVNEMRVHAAKTGAGSRGGSGGRGRGPRPAKVEVPETDFDFESANAKFNKQDLVKEAIAGPAAVDMPNGKPATPEAMTDAGSSNPAPAYNKSKSFFDNISSEAKDRAESGGQKPGGREWRGEEQRKNIETFGQGSIDGGYRGGYRGRGRGRGGRGRGYGRGGRGGGYRSRDNQQQSVS
ncbi:hypothetical protein VTK73DRAFT_5618 [Phialemonium thermophilum]|uniref:Uncharacterized protein n=1 Tax=Phialemonium thermophilum TaxID=223376 RepID=A0ABR3WML5_9PEZI